MKPPDRTDRVEKSKRRFAAPAPHAHRRVRAEQARKLADAEDAYKHAQEEADRLKAERDTVRARIRPVLPTGVTVIAGGIEIKVGKSSTGRSFRLAQYLKAGYKVTQQMRPFVGEATSYDTWSVERRKAA